MHSLATDESGRSTSLQGVSGDRSRDHHPTNHWLYRIATTTCLDLIRRAGRQVEVVSSFAEVPWLTPYPDRLLDEVAPREGEPEAVAVARETIELAYLAVVQLLPPRQRAVLLLRDVQGWSAAETAQMLDLSVAAANSALQRARATLREQLPQRASEWSAPQPTEQERELLLKFIDSHERGDARAAVAIMREDIRVTMPPHPWCYDGVAEIGPLLVNAFGPASPGEWRLLPTMVNRMPTAASYLRATGDTVFRPFKLDVLRVVDGAVAEVTTFAPALFLELGLPLELTS